MSFEDEEALRRAGCTREQQIAVWSTSVMPHLIIGTPYIATLPMGAARTLATHWPVRLVPFPFKQEPARSYAYWHPSRNDDPVLARFIGLIHQVIGAA